MECCLPTTWVLGGVSASEILWLIRAFLVEPVFTIRILAEVLHFYFDVQTLLFMESIPSLMGIFVSISIAAGNRC